MLHEPASAVSVTSRFAPRSILLPQVVSAQNGSPPFSLLVVLP